jgi:hypothetical protein
MYTYLKQIKMSFCKNEGQKDKLGPVWELLPVGMRRYRKGVKEGEYGGNILYSCMKWKNDTTIESVLRRRKGR